MSRGILISYDDAVRRAPIPTVLVRGRRYPTMVAGDLYAGDRTISPQGVSYMVTEPLLLGVLLLRGPNGRSYRWRRKPSTRLPVSWETRRGHDERTSR